MEEAIAARYWCHMCSQMVNPIMGVEMKCPFCQSGFIEEMDGTPRDNPEADSEFGPDRPLSLWAPILMGMMSNPRRRRRLRRQEFDEEEDEDNENDDVHGGDTELDRELESIIRRRRRSSSTILQLLRGIRAAGLASESDNLLCVFFRNNHFSTMFKFNGELYLLATDQGYLNQHDLVWEKLNEVNGDTLFMTGNFKEFKVENQSNENWDENNAVTSTADYLASIDSAASAGFDMNSDLQLAIALQQQEFEQQPQQQQQQPNVQQPSISGNSRMVTGPQGPRNNVRTSSTSSYPRPEKPKDKCNIM